MNALVLSNLLLNTAAIAALAVVMALAYCQPSRRRPRQWVTVETEAVTRASVAVQPAVASREEEELQQAA